MNDRVQEEFLSVQGSNPDRKSFRNNWKKKNLTKPGKVIDKLDKPLRDPTAEGICYDCGEKGHNRGEDRCCRPSDLTKKHRGDRDKEGRYQNDRNGIHGRNNAPGVADGFSPARPPV